MTAIRPVTVSAGEVGKRFDGVTEALREVTFTLGPGRILAVVGPWAAGKTTLLQLVAGLLPPDRGRITVVPHDARIGWVSAPRGGHPARSPRGQLRVQAAALGLTKRRIAEVLRQTEATGFADTRTDRLTPGQSTRAALAYALLGYPELLVLDEPTAGLLPEDRGWLLRLLHGYRRGGGTAVVTGESLAEVLPIADQLLILRHGSVVYRGSPARLRRGHPDRLVVASNAPAALATALAVEGKTDAVIRPDGRLAVADASAAHILAAAQQAGAQVHDIVEDVIHPDRVLASLTAPPTRPTPGMHP